MTTHPTFLFSSGTLFYCPNWPEEPKWPCLDCKKIDCPADEDTCPETRAYEAAKSAVLAGKIQVAEESLAELGKEFLNYPEDNVPYTIEVQGAMEIKTQILVRGKWRQIPSMFFDEEGREKRKVAIFVPFPETAPKPMSQKQTKFVTEVIAGSYDISGQRGFIRFIFRGNRKFEPHIPKEQVIQILEKLLQEQLTFYGNPLYEEYEE